MKEDVRIVGIGGMPRSGKDTLAELFIKAGYYGISFGDVLRDFARKRHSDKPDPISITNMTETSNWLRETRGPDVILQEVLHQYEQASKTKSYEGLVLYSVRAPAEVDWILARGGELVWVEASDEVRYQRNAMHQRQGEAAVSFDEFKRQEALQWKPQPGVPIEIQMNISYVKEHATRTLENNEGDLETFLRNAKALIDQIS